MKILVMGLPGSGKTTFAERLSYLLQCEHINADKVRGLCDDWDFSEEGRLRQAKRMSVIADSFSCSVTDFICPTKETRQLFGADMVIWMDTIKKGRYEDTNEMFVPPEKFDVRITEWR